MWWKRLLDIIDMLQEYQRGLRGGGGGGVLFNSDPFGQIKKGRRGCKNWTVFTDVMNLWSQIAIKTNSSSFRFVSFRFVIKLLKRMHKYRLTFAYYSITFLDFQSVLKTLKKIEKRCPSIEIPFLWLKITIYFYFLR